MINGADLSKSWTESARHPKRPRPRHLCLDWKHFQNDGRRLQELDDFSERGLTKKDIKDLIRACPHCGHWKTRRTFTFHECPEVIDLTDGADETEVDSVNN